MILYQHLKKVGQQKINMRKKRAYWGCEMESPLYRQVAAEMAAKREGKTVITEHKTKRGKRSYEKQMV